MLVPPLKFFFLFLDTTHLKEKWDDHHHPEFLLLSEVINNLSQRKINTESYTAINSCSSIKLAVLSHFNLKCSSP